MPEVPTNPTGLSKPESCAFLCTHFCLPFQKSAQLRKGPRYVELVLVVDNEEVREGEFMLSVLHGCWELEANLGISLCPSPSSENTRTCTGCRTA